MHPQHPAPCVELAGCEGVRLRESVEPWRAPGWARLTDEAGEIIVVYTPGGGHRFYEELGPATRNGTPDRAVVAAIFEKHDMSLLGPPLSAD